MRPPEFWKSEVHGRDRVMVLRALLTPISWAYAWAAARRIATTTPERATVPVVCIGNLTVGGAGKTPITRAIRAKLGPGAHTLSRGYGGTIVGPLRVMPDMDARQVGDEPLLHARDGAAWISRDRVLGAQAAVAGGAQAILLDDGYQNPALAKDLSLVAVDSGYGVGNGQVFPAGPLRERLKGGLARADAIILLNSAGDAVQETPWLSGFAKPILKAALEPEGRLPARRLIGFAGIARPEKFYDTLRALGADVEDFFPYPDHHVFSEDDLSVMARIAAERGATLITTEKDLVRLAPTWRARVATLPVRVRFEDEATLDALLQPIRSRMS